MYNDKSEAWTMVIRCKSRSTCFIMESSYNYRAPFTKNFEVVTRKYYINFIVYRADVRTLNFFFFLPTYVTFLFKNKLNKNNGINLTSFFILKISFNQNIDSKIKKYHNNSSSESNDKVTLLYYNLTNNYSYSNKKKKVIDLKKINIFMMIQRGS